MMSRICANAPVPSAAIVPEFVMSEALPPMATPREVVPSINPALVTVAPMSSCHGAAAVAIDDPAGLIDDEQRKLSAERAGADNLVVDIGQRETAAAVGDQTVATGHRHRAAAGERHVVRRSAGSFWLVLPRRLMLPALLSVAASSVSVAPFRTLTVPELTSTPGIRRADHDVEVAAGGIDRRAAAEDRDVDGGAAALDEELAATGNAGAVIGAAGADGLGAAAEDGRRIGHAA